MEGELFMHQLMLKRFGLVDQYCPILAVSGFCHLK